jgi:hypothetical protein
MTEFPRVGTTHRLSEVSARYLVLILLLLVACQQERLSLPTRAAIAVVPTASPIIPPTFTRPSSTLLPSPTLPALLDSPSDPIASPLPSTTPIPIPTNTPVPPTPTPTDTPTATPVVVITETPVIKPIHEYGYNEVIPYQAFPTPTGNNGWGMHWIPTVSQEAAVVDRFVTEMIRMHIRWVIFLNEGTNIGDNDYLVDRLVSVGIMPVMRLYRSALLPYDGNIAAMVTHYRARGVYYYQIYNEPNVNVENNQGFANPNQYAIAWASAARQVISAGGLPGIGAFSPGGAYNHYDFLDRTLRALQFYGDGHLLNHAWLSVHNYHGTRSFDDPEGFLLFRKYDEIIRSHLGRSLPIIGTEAGSYSPNRDLETQLIAQQYRYMRDAEPYFLAISYWVLANSEGGSGDDTWEWQALFQPGFVHPVVSEFFYQNRR